MWLFDGAANSTLAQHPFSCGEDQTREQGPSFARDALHFKLNPTIRFAIRRGCLEFDWVTEFGDSPAPRIYVAVYKTSAEVHSVTPIYRGAPFWRESTFCYGRYAAIQNDMHAFNILVGCHATDGMSNQARAHFDKHNLCVSQRMFAKGNASNAGKVN